MEACPGAWYNLGTPVSPAIPPQRASYFMAKPHRTLKKANHGSRPANSKARRLKRKHIRT